VVWLFVNGWQSNTYTYTYIYIVIIIHDVLVKFTSHLFVCSVMNLLAEIYSHQEMVPKMYKVFKMGDKEIENGASGCGNDGEENPFVLSTLAPRLWPFMRHSITSVRYSAMRTLVIIVFLVT